jgi:hypothetical protein
MAEPSFETGVSEDAAGAEDNDGELLEWADVDRVTVRAHDVQLAFVCMGLWCGSK